MFLCATVVDRDGWAGETEEYLPNCSHKSVNIILAQKINLHVLTCVVTLFYGSFLGVLVCISLLSWFPLSSPFSYMFGWAVSIRVQSSCQCVWHWSLPTTRTWCGHYHTCCYWRLWNIHVTVQTAPQIFICFFVYFSFFTSCFLRIWSCLFPVSWHIVRSEIYTTLLSAQLSILFR